MNIDPQWLNTQLQKFTHCRPLYERYADTLRPILEGVARLLCPSAVVQVRAKSLQSFADKVRRKADKYADPASQFTDLCGGRLITHLQAEVEAVCRFLREHFTIDEARSLDTISRLSRREFGYRSVHYVVQFKRGAFPTEGISVSIPEDLYPLKAEIQVRTLLQHAWAEMDHERLYLSPFKVPDHLDRESGRLAAAMESADEDFGRFAAAVELYQTGDGGHLDEQTVRDEMALVQVVRKHAPRDEALAHRLARLALRVRDWDTVIRLLDDIPDPRDAGLLCRIGHALCEQSQSRRGREFLERALRADARRVEPHIRLAEDSLRERKPKLSEVFGHYARAYDTDPTDPQALCGYIRYRVATERNLLFLRVVRPTVAAAVERCRAQAEAGVNLPSALYHSAELNLLLGPEQEPAALDEYLGAIQCSSAAHVLEALEALDVFEPVERDLPGIVAARRLLVLGLAARSGPQDPDVARQLADLQSPALCGPFDGSVAIIAGGCDPTVESQMAAYRDLLHKAVRHFRGTMISGGTREGIAGLVGELGEAYRGHLLTVAYLPAQLPADGTATLDQRYHIRRTTAGQRFSALEPLQCWIDLVASGVAPERVRVLGINGGAIAAFEYRLALLMGAKVGLVRDSGRKADTLAAESARQPIAGLALLPADPMTLEAFLTAGEASGLSAEQRELMAQRIHEDFLAKNRDRLVTVDPSLKAWRELDEDLRKSNFHQADDYQRKLAAIGKRAVAVRGREIRCADFTPEQVELLAEMEHGRYVAEKLLDGWTPGPRGPKQRPSLVAWTELPEPEREKDREPMRRLPWTLKEFGFEIQDLDATGGPPS